MSCSLSLHVCSNPRGDSVTRTAGLFVCLFHAGKVDGQNYKGMIQETGALVMDQSPLTGMQRVMPLGIKVLPFREPVGPKNWSLLSALSLLVVGIDSGLQEEGNLGGGHYT